MPDRPAAELDCRDCGHVEDEHGDDHDERACEVRGCGCLYYESPHTAVSPDADAWDAADAWDEGASWVYEMWVGPLPPAPGMLVNNPYRAAVRASQGNDDA